MPAAFGLHNCLDEVSHILFTIMVFCRVGNVVGFYKNLPVQTIDSRESKLSSWIIASRPNPRQIEKLFCQFLFLICAAFLEVTKICPAANSTVKPAGSQCLNRMPLRRKIHEERIAAPPVCHQLMESNENCVKAAGSFIQIYADLSKFPAAIYICYFMTGRTENPPFRKPLLPIPMKVGIK